MPTVVQIGAGAIGRGFLGQLWSDAGYEVVFVDTDESLVARLNERGSYPLSLRSLGRIWDRTISPVRAVSARDTSAVARELSACSFAAIAVGIRWLPGVAQSLVLPGLVRRLGDGNGPLNVLLCENAHDIRGEFLREIDTHVPPGTLGAVPAVIARMVPVPNDANDPLAVHTEPYHELPVNRTFWVGPNPIPDGVVAVSISRFAAYEKRKMYFHNGGHALLAYHGYRRGYTFLHECASDPDLIAELLGFWQEIGDALMHPDVVPFFPAATMQSFIADLLLRFQNPHLGDTVRRVARDPARKLARDDRLVGAALLCEARGIPADFTVRAIAAALAYDAPDDPTAGAVQSTLREGGVPLALERFAGLPSNISLVASIAQGYDSLGAK